MEVLFTYYEILTLILALVWVFIYLREPELRRELLILGFLSVLVLPLAFTIDGPIDEVAQEFSRLTITDIVFSFVIGGIAGTIFHVIFGKHYHTLPKLKPKSGEPGANTAQLWLMRLFIAVLLFLWGVVFLNAAFHMTIPAAVFVSAFVLGTYIVSHRHDLLFDAIWSGLLTSVIVFSSSTIATVFTNVDLTIAPVSTGYVFLDVPVDLLLWSLALGFALGPIYEYARRLELS